MCVAASRFRSQRRTEGSQDTGHSARRIYGITRTQTETFLDEDLDDKTTPYANGAVSRCPPLSGHPRIVAVLCGARFPRATNASAISA